MPKEENEVQKTVMSVVQIDCPLQFPLKEYSSSTIKKWTYLPNGICAEGHTPIYKLHKYFARRPQNVFRNLIEHYTRPGDLIVDPFCGGGVTVFEGVSQQRRVYGQDLNPLATFITRCQTHRVDIDEYDNVMNLVRKEYEKFSAQYYFTYSRKTGEVVPVRWYEHAFIALCHKCGDSTTLSNLNKAENDGAAKNGIYVCQSCKTLLKGVDSKKIGSKLLSVTYDSPKTGNRETHTPIDHDLKIIRELDQNWDILQANVSHVFPKEGIPEFWDRAQEDCLHRKGITKFTDLFTRRNLLSNAFILNKIRSFKGHVKPSTFDLLLLSFSSTLTYTNIMTISTDQWMDGRPVAWSKHAFWIPYQYIETNPSEFLRKRHKGIIQGLRYGNTKNYHSSPTEKYSELLASKTHLVKCDSSDRINLPDSSAHAVITDPPYGSNVQYGELSSFWLVWIKDDLGLKSAIDWFSREAVVHRKTLVNKKDHSTYYSILLSIFRECWRVLIPDAPLVFTFNNKDIRTLFCVLKAAIDAGFILKSDGIVYQEPIENYKNTSHQRFTGTIHGDFIYTFKKEPRREKEKTKNRPVYSGESLIESIKRKCNETTSRNKGAQTHELYLKLISQIIPVLIDACKSNDEWETQLKELESSNIDTLIEKAAKI